MIRAVLFDVGGPIDREEEHERLWVADIRAGLTAEGIAVDDDAYAEAARWAVESFAPNAYLAIIWRLTRQDAIHSRCVYAFVAARSHGRDVFELRPGIASLLARLRNRGLLLGLAANQPRMALDRLDAHGIGRFFDHREVSGVHGFYKPDVRLFLRACDCLSSDRGA